jgi:hypothetical protein
MSQPHQFLGLLCHAEIGIVDHIIYPPQPQRSRLLTCQDALRLSMATKLDPSEIVSFKELLITNSIQIDTAVQLMIEKGFFSEQEFFIKLKQVQAKYQAKRY